MPAPPVEIVTKRLALVQPDPDEAELVVDYYQRNRAHLEAWEPARPEGFYTAAFWRDRLRRNHGDVANDRAARLFLRLRERPGRAGEALGEGALGDVVGSCNFTEVVRGPFQACTLGFGLDGAREGQGLMHEALEAAIGWAWDALGVHRIQANHQPQNLRSGRLLRRLGFVVEGYARDYLHIGGAWRDHVLTSLTNPRW